MGEGQAGAVRAPDREAPPGTFALIPFLTPLFERHKARGWSQQGDLAGLHFPLSTPGLSTDLTTTMAAAPPFAFL